MKKILTLLIVLLTHVLFAHDSHQYNQSLRKWSLSETNNSLVGSFYMYKDGSVFIEEANGSIVNHPLKVFSKEDQTFVINRYERIKALNNRLTGDSIVQKVKPAWAPSKITISLIVLAFICCAVFFIAYKTSKLTFVFPVALFAVLTALFSFTGKLYRAFQTTTDPLSMDSAFAPFRPDVHTFWDSTYFYVESKGIPNHQMMAGITNWQQQVPIPQCYIGNNAWSIPLNPVIAASPVPVSPQHFLRGAIAVAVNGVAIFNPYTNTGADAFLTGQLDNFGGHCGRADDYHYHIAPLSLYSQTLATLPIAYALDGFAVYGNTEPDGSPMTTLDANNGHYHTNGVYHYHGVASAPYMIGNMVGQVTEDSTLQIIPQAHANPIRPAGTPLNGAVITDCRPNGIGNGYTLIYTLSGQIDSIVYNWTNNGTYNFNFYTPTGSTTQNYNGFSPCTVPLALKEIQSNPQFVSLYPNPTREGFKLKMNNGHLLNEIKNISLFNIKGELVYQTEIVDELIKTGNLNSGSYLLKIQFADYIATQRLIIQ